MQDRILRLLYVTSECAPWAKTGGLGDVAAGLPPALLAAGIDVRILLPGYAEALNAAGPTERIAGLAAEDGFPAAELLAATLPSGVPVMLLRCGSLYERPGGLYQDAQGQDWPDNARRYAFLARVAARLSGAASPLAWRPQVLHCNDWQTALAPAYLLDTSPRAATLVTIHNLAFQGLFDGNLATALGLPQRSFGIDGLEFYNRTSFLKGGLVYADAISTVSPTYAREIQRAPLGFGLEGVLQARRAVLSGILNGIDTDTWSPQRDALIARTYDHRTLELKAANKAALQERLGLEVSPATAMFGVVSRMTEQKGSDLLAAIAPLLAARSAQLAVLGSGERRFEEALAAAARAAPKNIATVIGFDERLAHLIEAGADMFLMPSRFEPCGLNQMYSQRYGTPPIAHATGGLVDSIVDASASSLADRSATGFLFHEATVPAFLEAVERALALYRQPARWRALQRAGMARDFGWEASAREYAGLYRRLAAEGGPAAPEAVTPPGRAL